jgi:protocatechuate 3,4-dioxygenase beta subunit
VKGEPVEGRERLREVVDGLMAAVHGAISDLGVTEEEWRAGLEYLTRVGTADEFVLLSDALHVSVLVDALAHENTAGGGTASNVEGPFYKPGAPMLVRPYLIAGDEEPGEWLFVSGDVVDAATGDAIPGAVLDVWQANDAGRYDLQDPSLGDFHLRGRMAVDDDGGYEFRTVVPPPYEIPKDGPVGELLRALGRHAFRPAHLHIKVTADGYAPLTTMVFFEGGDYLDSDTIAGVKDSLVVPLHRSDHPDRQAGRGVDRPFATCRFDVLLRKWT